VTFGRRTGEGLPFALRGGRTGRVQFLEISTRRYGRHALVALGGELDLAGAGEMRARLRAACEESDGRVILDLSELQFIDSTGLSILVEYHERARVAGGRLVLVAPRAAVVRILRITGLDGALKVCARVAEAADVLAIVEAPVPPPPATTPAEAEKAGV
jgi:anti-sigma B factor antagonist